ncbi:MAG: RdgB/HAM1 family non-canonical purine NTP pyrophosphatase [Lachnospiraceae bacterium]|nr:RdgB/HAM1 family non-canonical purine NTP pyrophosphatase [Lachnospiraceae bacterium]
MRILFATENRGKLREAEQILADTGLEVLPLSAAGVRSDPEENGETFEDNALIKVRAARAALATAGEAAPESGDPADGDVILADDSGLMIDAFDGGPGVHSARWMGHDTSYDVKNAKVLELLAGKTGAERAARYVCAIAASLPDGREFVTAAPMEGVIAETPAGAGGFGYDPIFLVEEYGKTAAELTPDEKNAVSHRGKALRQMRAILGEALGGADRNGI